MSTDIIKYAFIAGELSPTLFGRTDLTKFDLGMAEALNFFVDYRGGLSTRPGTEFFEHVKADDKQTKYVPFVFNPDEEDTYIILFGDEYIRVMQGGSYILEDAVSCTVSNTLPVTVTAVAHGLISGRWIKAGGKTYEVGPTTANTFQLLSVPSGAAVTDLAFTFTTFQAVFELPTPFAAADLEALQYHQYRDRLRITGVAYAPQDLIRIDVLDWSLADAVISDFYVGPSVTSHSASAVGDAQTVFAVTKVLEDGTESIIGTPYKVSGVVNYPITEGSVSIQWPAAADASYYNIYRSVISVSEELSLGSELGYAGRAYGTKFTDPNIVPDFGRLPPRNYHPFAPGAITSVTLTGSGAGYITPPAVSASGGGSGFSARAILDDSGAVVNVLILNGGEGYTAPGISFSGGGGASATATARALTGTYPALSTLFQRRQVFAASSIEPITIWGSQIDRFTNFNYSEYSLDTDSYEFRLDTAAIDPIKHLLPTRGGLLAMTQDNVWIVSGGGGDKAITPSSVLADPQTYTGVSDLDPIRIGANILYVESKGYAVRSLSYNELSRVYAGADKSILSNHLFGKNKQIVRWAFQESPYKVVWCVRSDGALIAHTTVEEEEVFAWTPCQTQGKFTDVVVIREGNEDRVYLMAERFIAGRWTKFHERMDLRQFTNVEDAWCVDCGLTLPMTSPAGSVAISRTGTAYSASISGGSWAGSADKILRAGNGIFKVLSFAGDLATLQLRQPPSTWVPETDESYTYPIPSGQWTLDAEVTEVSGLDHLEGETISILADGNVITRAEVTNGAFTLTQPASRIIAGLRFTCKAKTLPLIVPDAGIEAKRKRIVAVAVRLTNSRALRVGDSYDSVYEFPERTSENYGSPVQFQEGIQHTPIGTTWDEESHTYFLLTDPLPATLLSLVQDVEVGDDAD